MFILLKNSLNIAFFQRIFPEHRDKNLISLHKFALKERIRLVSRILLWPSHAFWCGIDNSLCEIKWSGCHEGALVCVLSMLILHFFVLFIASFFFDFDYLLFEFIVSDLVLHELLNRSLYLIFLIVYATSSKIKCLLVWWFFLFFFCFICYTSCCCTWRRCWRFEKLLSRLSEFGNNAHFQIHLWQKSDVDPRFFKVHFRRFGVV